MSRYAKTLIVILASVVVGACAGRTRVVVNHTAPAPVAQEAAIAEIDILPIRNLEIGELTFGTAQEPKNLDPTPSCDIAAVVAQTVADEELAKYPISAGTRLHQYAEVRFDVLDVRQDYDLDIGVRVLDLDTCTTKVIGIRKTYGKGMVRVPYRKKDAVVWKEEKHDVALLQAPFGWNIEVVRRAQGVEWNNWGTELRILEPANHVVVGVRWPNVTSKSRTAKNRITPVIYVPYVRELHLAELISAGQTYLDDVASQAYDELRRLKVMSKAFPGTPVANVAAIESGFITSLAANEHMDPGEFALDPKWTAERIHIVIGANRERTAAFTCSGADACGLMQFMAETYRDTRKAYPAAKLIADTTEGRRNHLNAMKAAILLLDNNLAYFRERLGEVEFARLLKDRRMLRELLVSAYNTGAGRTATVYLIHRQKGPAEWTEAKGKRCSRANNYAECLLLETKGYVAKDRFLDSWRPPSFAVKP